MGTAVAVPERGIDQNSLWAALTPAGLRRCRSSFKTLLWSRFVERGSHPEPTHQQKIKKGHPIGQPFFILWRWKQSDEGLYPCSGDDFRA